MTLHEATQRQIDAAIPGQSTWLSANAGSGKTRVLTDRVARLLLDGVEPQNILCLTYTKAAASEMQNRLFRRLGSWAMMPDDTLRTDLQELGVPFRPDGQRLRHARTLFAKAIETPGGLKIQTIHAFCAGILRRFPLEAGLSPQFREMEDRDAELLQYDVLDQMAEGTDGPLIDGIARYISDAKLIDLIKEIAKNRAAFLPGANRAEIAAAFGLSPDARIEDALSIAFEGGEAGLIKDIGDCVIGLGKKYNDFAGALARLRLDPPDMSTLSAIFEVLLYSDKTSYSRNFPTSTHTNAVAAFAPVVDDLHAWMDRTAAAWQHRLAVDSMNRACALHDFAGVFLARYDRAKLLRGVLDFDDLIRKTRDLLNDPGLAQWVLFKLDGGIDHILVDEAQDTAPAQWDVIEALTREFTTGIGARGDRNRTIFVVGDKKQSIYSFQGADPEGFDRMRAHFQTELARVDKSLQTTSLSYSFRSSIAILSAVDAVFWGPLRDGLEEEVRHHAFKSDLPGRVDLWPMIEPEKSGDKGDWTDPVDAPGPQDHETLLAERIAGEIHRMCREETLPTEVDGKTLRRPISEGDFLILVRRRKRLFSEILRACKARGLRVAGADQLTLLNELAVRDILALLRFLSLAEDDLSLATALRSPLFGWTEGQLYDLAQGRERREYLWQRLRASTNPNHAETLSILNDLRDQADYLRPYELIERLLTRHRGRKRLLARLGEECEEGIGGLVAQALAYEKGNVPGLTGFLHWIEGEDIKIKRQLDRAGDQIRIMTVHGSKGLEAPIVILPDTATPKREVRDMILSADRIALWKGRKEDNPDQIVAASAVKLSAQEREFRRLLYVAMTRAEKWLIVAGAGEPAKDVGDAWHAMVADAMPRLGAVDMSGPEGTVIQRFEALNWSGLPLAPARPATGPLPQAPVFAEISADAQKNVTLSPSDLGGAKVLAGDTDAASQDVALATGRLIHLLLEHLPKTLADNRATLGCQIIDNAQDAGLVPDRSTLLAQVIALIDSTDLAHLWASDTLAEVEITARLGALGGAQIHGAIDRLIVQPDHILVIDFKSNRLTPARAEDTPEGILRQMGAYVAALSQVYPDRMITASVLWTTTGQLMELPNDLIGAALSRYGMP